MASVQRAPEACGPIGPRLEAPTGRHTDADSAWMGVRISLHFRSSRRSAAGDGAERAGTPRYGWAIGGPFVQVRADDWGRVGMGGDAKGNGPSHCKIAGLRLPRFESWSCHTPPDLWKRGFCASVHAAPPGRISLRFRSAGRVAAADRTVPAPVLATSWPTHRDAGVGAAAMAQLSRSRALRADCPGFRSS